jgi:hypothetical protein
MMLYPKFKLWNATNKQMSPIFRIIDLVKHEADLTWYSQNTDIFEWLQFTGLHDKYNNEIYEGDVLKADSCEKEVELAEVIWEPPMFKRHSKYGTWSIGTGKQWIAIGNKYQNPELLR